MKTISNIPVFTSICASWQVYFMHTHVNQLNQVLAKRAQANRKACGISHCTHKRKTTIAHKSLHAPPADLLGHH